tara:strand:+ start:41 stop:235 length:195 start_codon:yes stop_codon:yes gene_type:complete
VRHFSTKKNTSMKKITSFIPSTWIVGNEKANKKDIIFRQNLIKSRTIRSKQRVEKEFPRIKLTV